MKKAKFWVDWLLEEHQGLVPFRKNSQTSELYKGNSKVH